MQRSTGHKDGSRQLPRISARHKSSGSLWRRDLGAQGCFCVRLQERTLQWCLCHLRLSRRLTIRSRIRSAMLCWVGVQVRTSNKEQHAKGAAWGRGFTCARRPSLFLARSRACRQRVRGRGASMGQRGARRQVFCQECRAASTAFQRRCSRSRIARESRGQQQREQRGEARHQMHGRG